MNNQQEPKMNETIYTQPVKQKQGLSIGAAIVLGLSAIIVTAIIVGGIIVLRGADIIETLETLDIHVTGDISEEEGGVNINVNQTEDNIQISAAALPSVSPILVKDADTGVRITNMTISLDGQIFTSEQDFVNYAQGLPAGDVTVTVAAPGYETMDGININIPGNLSGLGINLVPINPVYNLPVLAQGDLRITGFVTDRDDASALAGVQVSLSELGLVTTTNSEGQYYFDIDPQVNMGGCEGLTMVMAKTGYETLNINDFGIGGRLQAPETVRTRYTLQGGSGSEAQQSIHGMCL